MCAVIFAPLCPVSAFFGCSGSPEGLPLPRMPKHYAVKLDYTSLPVCERHKDKLQGILKEVMHLTTFVLATWLIPLLHVYPKTGVAQL